MIFLSQVRLIMDASSLTFNHLMCAKFCHDLAAPLGAARMGLEMLQESPSDPTIPMLIQESTESAIARLNIFRCLTGYASTPTKPTGSDIHTALRDYLDKKTHLQWDLQEPNLPEGAAARLLLALILTASDTLFRGGTLTVSPHFKVTAKTENGSPMLHEEILNLFEGEPSLSQQTPKSIIAYFATILAKQMGGRITINKSEPSILQLQVVS